MTQYKSKQIVKIEFRQGQIASFGYPNHRFQECRGGNNDAELWFGRKIEGFNHEI